MANDYTPFKGGKKMYSVNSTEIGFKYWQRRLYNIVSQIFEWNGLPKTLPQEQIEQRLILNGWCGVFYHGVYGIVTCDGSLSGYDIYNIPTTYIYNQPILGSGKKTIGKGAVVGYNSYADRYFGCTTNDMVARYARLLADIQSSINISVVNQRANGWAVADNEIVAKSVRDVYNKLEQGEFDVITTKTILDSFHTFPTSVGNSLQDLYDTFSETLKAFYADIGISYMTEKKERMITSEVDVNNTVFQLNLSNMLTSRKLFAEGLNAEFNLSVDVGINSAITKALEGVTINDNQGIFD